MPATILPMHTRQGVCQPEQCGSACCTFVLLEVNPIYQGDDLAAWLQLHGISVSTRHGRTLAKIPLECSALGTSGRCVLYGRPERPALCDAYPMTPLSLLGVEGVCTYTFEAGPGLELSERMDSTPEAP